MAWPRAAGPAESLLHFPLKTPTSSTTAAVLPHASSGRLPILIAPTVKPSTTKPKRSHGWIISPSTRPLPSILTPTNNPEFRNSHFAGLVVKDAICDVFREKTGQRPSVEVYNPAVQIHVFIFENKATISFDTTGAPLFKRGYRAGAVEAPLQETLAAAILKYADYTADDVLCDPFCGSGTFLWEAALMATNTPAAYFRKNFGFFNHPLYKEEEWLAIKLKLDSRIQDMKAVFDFWWRPR